MKGVLTCFFDAFAELDEAVAAQQLPDGTGGRGANGPISRALGAELPPEIVRNAV